MQDGSQGWETLRADHFEGSQPVSLVSEYFEANGSGPVFTGSLFNTWADGGSRHPDVVTSDDLIAVQLLSMRPSSKTIWNLLEGERQNISAALSRIPPSATLWGEPEAVNGQLLDAQRAWDAIQRIHGASWVTAGKILARKRPNLIPVYDSVVRDVLGNQGRSFWRPLSLDPPMIMAGQ